MLFAEFNLIHWLFYKRAAPARVSGESRRLDIARGLWQEAKGMLRGEE